MKPFLLLPVVVVAALVVLAVFDERESNLSVLEQKIALTEAGFEPRESWIKRGGTAVFSTDRGKPFWPASNLHPQHDIYPAFDPERALSPEEVWSFTFNEEGTFGYHDHLRAYFNGVIYVE